MTYGNACIYSVSMLWATYGITFAVSLVSVVIGFVWVSANRG